MALDHFQQGEKTDQDFFDRIQLAHIGAEIEKAVFFYQAGNFRLLGGNGIIFRGNIKELFVFLFFDDGKKYFGQLKGRNFFQGVLAVGKIFVKFDAAARAGVRCIPFPAAFWKFSGFSHIRSRY